jgi:Domain of unknown function (DUF222)
MSKPTSSGTGSGAVRAGGVDVSDLDLPGLATLVASAGDSAAGSLPGGRMAEFLGALDPAGLDTDTQALDLVVATDRLKAWADGLHLASVAEFARRPDAGPRADPLVVRAARRPLGRVARAFPGDELAAALRTSVRVGDQRVALACALAGRLPQTLAALAAGRLDYPRAAAMAHETTGCTDSHAAAAEASVLAVGRRATPSKFRNAVRRAVAQADPAAARAQAQRASQDHRVEFSPADQDAAELLAHLPAGDAAAIRTVLDAAANAMSRLRGETRTLGQLRAAALAAPFWAALAAGHLDTATGPLALPTAHGQAPAVQLDPSTGELRGYGPVTDRARRDLAARSGTGPRPVVRLVTPPTAAEAQEAADCWPAEPGYRPSARLARHVLARDQHCVFPPCSCPAAHCDLDHTRPWPNGPTHPANLGPPCRRHHRLKQHPAVHLQQPQPGRFVWTMPTGHTYTNDKEP